MKKTKHYNRSQFSSVYAPAVSDGVLNPRDERHLYSIARILGDFPNLANGERSAGIECLLTNGTIRRMRWDRLVTLTAG